MDIDLLDNNKKTKDLSKSIIRYRRDNIDNICIDNIIEKLRKYDGILEELLYDIENSSDFDDFIQKDNDNTFFTIPSRNFLKSLYLRKEKDRCDIISLVNILFRKLGYYVNRYYVNKNSDFLLIVYKEKK